MEESLPSDSGFVVEWQLVVDEADAVIDLSGIDLSGIDLSGAGAQVRRSDLAIPQPASRGGGKSPYFGE